MPLLFVLSLALLFLNQMTIVDSGRLHLRAMWRRANMSGYSVCLKRDSNKSNCWGEKVVLEVEGVSFLPDS